MAEEDQEASSRSRLGWFTAGALSTLVAIALFVFIEDRLSSRVEADAPSTIIEAH